MGAQEQEAWRRLNDRQLRAFRDKGRLIAFVCECGRGDCRRSVMLTPEEYEARRPGLILHHSHDEPQPV